MVKFDVSLLRYLSKDDFRVLTAIEMGMRNHELVPVELIDSIARLKHGGTQMCLSTLLRAKLIKHERKMYDGYALKYSGYDYLALHSLTSRGVISGVGRQIGVGKESDVFLAQDADGNEVALKFNRLGRTSFRNVKNLRDYHKHRAHCNWLYLSRLAALKEIAFMRALHDNGFPVPTPIDQNRHVVVMSLVKGSILNKVPTLERPGQVFARIMDVMIRLARCGLVHCDFNEFNMFVDDDDRITIIDFPQMVSVDHPNAVMLFDRDTQCLRVFFERRFGFIASAVPSISVDCAERLESLDNAVKASGFDNEHQRRLEQGLAILGVDMAKKREKEASGGGGHGSDSEDGDDDEEFQGGDAAGETEHEPGEGGPVGEAPSEGSSVSSGSGAGSGLESEDEVEPAACTEFAGTSAARAFAEFICTCDDNAAPSGMSVRQQRRAIAEARARKGKGGGGVAAGGQSEGSDAAAAEGSRVPAATALRTPAAEAGLQVMHMRVICACQCRRVPHCTLTLAAAGHAAGVTA